ncbi:hypothetical protein Sjap_008152 [Stephania japonica]|uniref:Uncharacterized protein n=1 Tax=Stephania japonica TaxID=461633 RepID=A0AAP0PAK8_9MAGN
MDRTLDQMQKQKQMDLPQYSTEETQNHFLPSDIQLPSKVGNSTINFSLFFKLCLIVLH